MQLDTKQLEYNTFKLFYTWCEFKNKTKVIKYLQENNVEVYGLENIVTIVGVHETIPNYVYKDFQQFKKDYLLFIRLYQIL